MKKLLFLTTIIFSYMHNANAEQLMYKCKGDKSFVYYKNINNKSNYNGWYEMINYNCDLNKSFINATCDQGVMYLLDDDGNRTSTVISGINCGNFNLSFPQSNYVL